MPATPTWSSPSTRGDPCAASGAPRRMRAARPTNTPSGWRSSWRCRASSSKGVTGAIISTVVPAATYGLVNFIRRYGNTEPVMAEEAWARMGVPIRIDRPEQVGADRVVNAVAAHAKLPGRADRHRLRHRHHLRHRRTRRRLRGRRASRPGRTPRSRRSTSPPRACRASPSSSRSTVIGKAHRAGDAVGRLLGLRRPDRGPGPAHQGGVRRGR